MVNALRLFVGGVADGQWNSVDRECDIWRVAGRLEVEYVLRYGEVPDVFDAPREDVYRPVEINTPNRKYCVMALVGMTDSEVIAALIHGYKKAKKPNKPAFSEGH